MSTGIDANVVLGLAAKAVQVFARPETFLSFPLAPIGFERSALRALITDPLGPTGQLTHSEYSRLVNQIPSGPLWPSDGGWLWDIYGDVLDADLAEAVHTPEQEREYQRAYGFLKETRPDGSVVDSPMVVAYEQYRDAYIAAALEYNNRKGQVEFSTDPVVQQQWSIDEPVLQDRVAKAEADWATAGHRAEVEDARRVLRGLGSGSPLMVWLGYRKLFDPDLPEISFRTSPDGSTYLPTAYVPSDVLDLAWPRITVTRAELMALVAGVPESLRSRLSGSSVDTAVDLVSFEYSYVTVHRPWFMPEVFASRAWRFYEPKRVLSDGATPPRGECTAYVSGLALARNITIHRRASDQPDQPTAKLGFVPTERLTATTPVARAYGKDALAERTVARRALVQAKLTAPLHVSPVARATRPLNVSPVARVTRPLNVSLIAPRVQPANTALSAMAGPLIAAKRAVLTDQPVVRPETPNETTVVTTTDVNEVYVLAFICRLLPKAPDPDPALSFAST